MVGQQLRDIRSHLDQKKRKIDLLKSYQMDLNQQSQNQSHSSKLPLFFETQKLDIKPQLPYSQIPERPSAAQTGRPGRNKQIGRPLQPQSHSSLHKYHPSIIQSTTASQPRSQQTKFMTSRILNSKFDPSTVTSLRNRYRNPSHYHQNQSQSSLLPLNGTSRT